MNRLSEHEAFLRAIFDAPDDDTPRLVYADFLDENGLSERAELIRTQCELAIAADGGIDGTRREWLEARSATLSSHLATRPGAVFQRGFDRPGAIHFAASELADPDVLRQLAATECPEWYGETALEIEPDRAIFPEEVPVLFGLPFTQRIVEWNLGGVLEEIPAGPPSADAGTFGLIDLIEHPVINPAGVEALAQCRGARRVRTLVLTNNRLDNDAARALIASPYLINLTRLDLYEGNRFRGRVWQQLIERFGEKVVG